MSIVLLGSTSGSITLQEPAVAGTTVLSLPATSGTLLTSATPFSNGQGPAFSAYQSSAQSISANTFTIINLQTEVFDTNNNFASNRFTPTVAGYYQINASLNTTTPLSSSIYFNIYIVKNGTGYTLVQGYPSPSNYFGVTSSTVVYLNGSTDYIEMGTQSNSAYTVQADSRTTFLSGCLVRAA